MNSATATRAVPSDAEGQGQEPEGDRDVGGVGLHLGPEEDERSADGDEPERVPARVSVGNGR